MRLGKDLEGKPIVSVADGRILGRAKDIFVDPELSELVGLFTGMEGVIRRRTLVIPSVDVVLFGIDVILVRDADVIVNDQKLPEVKEWQRLKQLQGREVVTSGGTKLGIVGDVILEATGNIVGLNLSRVFVKGPLADKGSVPREAIVEPRRDDGTIGVDLALLEQLASGVDVQSLEGEDAKLSKEAISNDSEDEEVPVVEVEEISVETVDSQDAIENEESTAENAADEDEESADMTTNDE